MYTREFYARRFSIKFCHYTARQVRHKILPLYSKTSLAEIFSIIQQDKNTYFMPCSARPYQPSGIWHCNHGERLQTSEPSVSSLTHVTHWRKNRGGGGGGGGGGQGDPPLSTQATVPRVVGVSAVAHGTYAAWRRVTSSHSSPQFHGLYYIGKVTFSSYAYTLPTHCYCFYLGD